MTTEAKHIDGVCWLLLRNGCVLLERCPKKAEKLGVGEWFVPGGKVEGDETLLNCLLREVAEEWPGVHIMVRRQLPIVEGSPVGIAAKGIFLMMPFLIVAEREVPTVSADGIPLRWVPIREALQSPVPQVRMMVAAACDGEA